MRIKHNYELKPLFVKRMKKLLGKDFQSYLDILKVFPVKSLRCNTLKISPDKLKKRLEDKGWKISQPWSEYPEVMIVEGKIAENNFSEDKKSINNKLIIDKKRGDNKGGVVEDILDLEPGELGRSLEHLLGYYYIQELASMLPILVLKPKPEERVLDLCAAPGSKTTQAAATMENTGAVIANEVSLGRLKILASNLERCGVTNSIMTRKEGIAFCKRMKNAGFEFDKILVDAPCSGEGTLRSTPKTYKMWNIKTIQNLSRLQKALISAAFEILKPGGEIVYSTCTHAPEENEEIVDYVLNNFEGVKIEKVNLPIKCRQGITKWEDKEYSEDVTKCCRVYPQDANTEGFFIAKMRKGK